MTMGIADEKKLSVNSFPIGTFHRGEVLVVQKAQVQSSALNHLWDLQRIEKMRDEISQSHFIFNIAHMFKDHKC